MIDNSGDVFPIAVRQHWEGSGLTFVGIVYGAFVGIAALVMGAASLEWRLACAALLLAVGVLVFWPGRFKASSLASRYLTSAGGEPK